MLKIFTLSLISLIAATLIYFTIIRTPNDFQYFSYQCRIYNRSGEIIENMSKYGLCAYKSNGQMIASEPSRGKLALLNAENKKIWSSNEIIHHDLKFSSDEKGILLISSELTHYEGELVRSDCFSHRDLNNNMIAQWCLSQNIELIKKLGLPIGKGEFGLSFFNQKIKHELSHANSIYEIPQNPYSDMHPAFEKGNYIVNLFGSTGALLILDKSMTKVLWSLNFYKFLLDNQYYFANTHDVQVLKSGNILAYFNFITPIEDNLNLKFKNLFKANLGLFNDYYPRKNLYSKLIEFNPITQKTVWAYEDSPYVNFYSEVSGTITKLTDSVLYSDTTYGGRYIEITFAGKKKWTYIAPENEKILANIKPILDTSYLKSKGLVD